MSKNPWFARFREGLFKDPSGKHRKRMGEAIWLYGYLHICADLKTGQLFRTYETMADESGIPKGTVRRMLKKLKKPRPGLPDGYIIVRQLSRGLHLSITKWEPPGRGKRVPMNGHPKNSEGDHIRKNECSSMERVSINEHSPNDQNNELKSSRVFTDSHSNKTHITRPKTYIQIFEFWNEQEICVHRVPAKFKSCIIARLKNYSVDEICQAIQNYADILNSQDHFFSHRWTISDFLTRKNGIDRFMDRAAAFENFRKNGSPATPVEPPQEETKEELEAKKKEFEKAWAKSPAGKYEREMEAATR